MVCKHICRTTFCKFQCRLLMVILRYILRPREFLCLCVHPSTTTILNVEPFQFWQRKLAITIHINSSKYVFDSSFDNLVIGGWTQQLLSYHLCIWRPQFNALLLPSQM